MIPLPKQKSDAVKAFTLKKRDSNMTANEMIDFQNKHGFSDDDLATFLGVTKQAVRLWTRGQREINMTITRVLRLLDRYPHLLKEF